MRHASSPVTLELRAGRVRNYEIETQFKLSLLGRMYIPHVFHNFSSLVVLPREFINPYIRLLILWSTDADR